MSRMQNIYALQYLGDQGEYKEEQFLSLNDAKTRAKNLYSSKTKGKPAYLHSRESVFITEKKHIYTVDEKGLRKEVK